MTLRHTKPTPLRLWFGLPLGCGLALLVGCAHAKLEVKIDLFEADPLELITDPEREAAQSEALIDKVLEASQSLAKKRTASINASFNAISAGNKFLNTAIAIQDQVAKAPAAKAPAATEEAPTKEVQREEAVGAGTLTVLRTLRDKDKAAIHQRLRAVEHDARIARDAVLAYRDYRLSMRDPDSEWSPAVTGIWREQIARYQLQLVESSEAIASYDSAVESYVAANRERVFDKWPSQINKLVADLGNRKHANKSALEALEAAYGAFVDELGSVDDALRGAGISRDSLRENLAPLDFSRDPTANSEAIRKALTAWNTTLSGATERIASTLDYDQMRSQAIRNTQLNSQIDRLQDPADPMLRVIASKQFQRYWNNDFSRTFSRAEGDFEVVIIRDRVGHFKVKSAKNNPAALIEGQLKINRALAAGAVDILAAASGVPGINPGLSKRILTKNENPPKDGDPTPDSGTQSAFEQLAKARSDAEIVAEARQGLLQALQPILVDVQAVPAGTLAAAQQKEIDKLEESRLRTVELLEAYLSRFEEESSTSPAPTPGGP